MKRHHESFRRIQVAQFDPSHTRIALRIDLECRHLFLADLRHTDPEHDMWRVAGREPREIVAADLVGTEPDRTDHKRHRRPRLLQHVHPADGIFQNLRQPGVEKQAKDQRHNDHGNTPEQRLAQILQVFEE